MERKDPLSGFFRLLRDNKRAELTVYALIAALIAGILLFSGGISCGGGQARKSTAADPSSESELEARLEAILSRIDGAGRVSVMVTLGREKAEPASSLFSQASSGEDRTVLGAIVVAEGARSISVMNALREAASTSLGLPPSSVGVFPMKNEKGR
ncbi:MAG: hypothetical protein J6P98_01470 [Clostridia bacterium]|nr:hypothetical protein [Clostridia bacterium]